MISADKKPLDVTQHPTSSHPLSRGEQLYPAVAGSRKWAICCRFPETISAGN